MRHVRSGTLISLLADQERLLDRKVVVSLHGQITPEWIEAGTAQVMQQLGELFRWTAIADPVVPDWLSTAVFGWRTLYNCANLVARLPRSRVGSTCPTASAPPDDRVSERQRSRRWIAVPRASGHALRSQAAGCRAQDSHSPAWPDVRIACGLWHRPRLIYRPPGEKCGTEHYLKGVTCKESPAK
jgi:hypothetical protein